MSDLAHIQDNIKRLRERIVTTALQVGRSPDEIAIVAVSKTFPVEFIAEALKAGITDIGENRVQEAEPKIKAVRNLIQPGIESSTHWHLVGHLQSNKARKAIELFNLIHSIDSLSLAQRLSDLGFERNKPVEILLQVNTSREQSKSGIKPEKTVDLAGKICQMKGIALKGLMTIGMLTDNQKEIRRCFQLLKTLLDQINHDLSDSEKIKHLSMGMTSDFEIAIEEGATLIRIGTAIFGIRT